MSDIFYRNFDMQILRAREEYLAQTESPDAGNASLNFTLPFSEDGLEALLPKLGPARRVRGVETPIEAAKRLGGQLYKAIFSAGIGSALDRSIEAAKRESERLRIRLRLTNVPELANLPWEYLYDELNDRFLALSYKTSIVRYLEIPQSVNPLAVKPPLRALVMASSPIGYDALGVDKEWSNLQTALGKMPRGLVEVERTEKATLKALQERLSGGNQYHIFHYIGHGGFAPRTGKSFLVMEDDNRQARFVDGPQLGVLLHNHPSLRIAILNACEGAVSNQNNVFTGVAQSLIRQEMPAVIAMQFEITDSVAIILAKAFYESLARSAPVDTALAEARLAVFAAEDGIEWGTPVLYLRAHDGRLFDVESLSISVSQPAPSADAPSQTTGQKKPENLPPTEPSGPLSPSSSFYIEREADKTAMDPIASPGIALSIKASGQTGANSLLRRLMEAARQAGKRAARINSQQAFNIAIFIVVLLSSGVLAYRFWSRARAGGENPAALVEKEVTNSSKPVEVKSARVEVMRYYLGVESNDDQPARATGIEPLTAGQAFKFHFIPRERGYLYIIAPGERNLPTTFLTARPIPASGVTTNHIGAGVDYSFPSGEGKGIVVGQYGSITTFTIIFSPTPLTTPGFLAASANRRLTAAERHELEAFWQQFGKDASELAPETGANQAGVAVTVSADRASGRPIIFDIPIKRR